MAIVVIGPRQNWEPTNGLQSERSDVQTPARSKIWIEISAPCASLLHLFYSILFTYLYSAPLAVKTNLGPHVKWIAEPVQSLDLPSERKKGSSKRCRHFGRKEKT